jgi:hypothetical protein
MALMGKWRSWACIPYMAILAGVYAQFMGCLRCSFP